MKSLSARSCRIPTLLGLMAALVGWSCGRTAPNSTASARTVLPTPPTRPELPEADGSCKSGFEPCGSGAGRMCYALANSPENCGGCGIVCPLGTPCQEGACQVVRCQWEVTTQRRSLGNVASGLPSQFAVADFNLDGRLDMVAPTPYDGKDLARMGTTATVSLGNSEGGFTAGQTFPAARDGFYVLAADLNHDGYPDLALRGTVRDDLPHEQIHIRLGRGDGTFGEPWAYAAGEGTVSIAISDLDQDGILDLASSASQSKSVMVRYGRGDGRFSEPRMFAIAGTPTWLVVADWSRDGIPDLVVADEFIHLILGTGHGQFAPVVDCPISLGNSMMSSPAGAPVLADFDADGVLDLAISNTLLFGMQGCSFSRQLTYAISQSIAFPRVADDFNGDGATDLVVSTWDGFFLLTGDGRGGFGKPLKLDMSDNAHAQPDMQTAIVADVDSDGRRDLIVTGNSDGIRWLRNDCN